MSYRYLLYGLNVESEIEIEEAYSREFEGEADVKVVAGQMPPEVNEIFGEKAPNELCSAVSGNAFAYRIPEVGDYLVTRDVITVSVSDNAPGILVKSSLLGSAFGYCMFLRKQVLLHGGALARMNKTDGATGIIITGESGSGKSTVLDALMEQGYMFIADDVCSVTETGGKPHINMAYPQKKLCRDAAIAHGYDLSELIYINEDRDKFAVQFSEGFLPEGADFKYLFELVVEDAQLTNITVREITGAEKLKAVLRNIYRGEDNLKMWGISPEYMQMCLKIASGVKIYRIVRPRGVETLDEITGVIDRIVRN